MLYCDRCGQCVHINQDQFYGFCRVTGTEKQYLDPESGDVEESDGLEDTDYGDTEYECPNCHSGGIDSDWHGEAEEAFEQRAIYEKERKIRQKEREQEELSRKIKDSDWDLATNEVHK